MKDKIIAKQNNPNSENYYLVKTSENKWGIAFWDGKKFWDDPEQNKKLSFGIKREFIIDWYILPLEQESREPIEDYPVYDKEYLNECIKKATPNLSKIKDVDKALDEIRGVEQEGKEQTTDRCHKIYDKVKEAWTPDKRTFEQTESREITDKEIEKQLLDRFGFIDEGIDAENQLKIFSFMKWYREMSKPK